MDAGVTGVSGGWSRDRGEASLSDVNRSVVVRSSGPTWRRAAAFVGPGYLVAVGYMDPGNWVSCPRFLWTPYCPEKLEDRQHGR